MKLFGLVVLYSLVAVVAAKAYVDCQPLFPDEPCMHRQCPGFQPWPKRQIHFDTSHMPHHDEIAHRQLQGDCEPLKEVDEQRYRRCMVTMNSSKTFVSHPPETADANDTAGFSLQLEDIPELGTFDLAPSTLNDTNVAPRGDGPPRCCILTQGCYDYLGHHQDEKIDLKSNELVWKKATCCMILWDLSCEGKWSYYPPKFYRPPRCSNPEYP